MTLFDDNLAATLARRDGPETSKAAARRIAPKIKGKKLRALEVIRRHPDKTQKELDALEPDPNDHRAIGKRCNELVDDGVVEVSGERDGQMTYRVVEGGQ